MGQTPVNSSNSSSCTSVEVNYDYQQPIQSEILEQYQDQNYCYLSNTDNYIDSNMNYL